MAMAGVSLGVVNAVKLESRKDESNFLYYGLLAYTVIFFCQIGGRISVLKPLRIEFVLGIFLLLSIAFKIVRGEISLSENRLNTAAVLLLAVMFATIPIAYVKSRALATFVQVFKIFAIYLMIVAAIDSEEKLRKFMIVYVCVNAFLFVEPFFLSLRGEGFIYNNHMWRLAGTTSVFGHPNALGMITSSTLPFLYYFMKFSKSKGVKAACVVLILIGLRVIMLTQSRTAFLGALTFVGLVWLGSRKKVLTLVLGIAFLGVLWTVSPDQTKQRFLTLGESARVMTEGRESLSEEEKLTLGSMSSRWDLMRKSLIAFYENPILGLGLDCFASFNGRRWGLWFPPHNTYLQVLAETGLIGSISLFILIWFTFKNLRQAKQAVRESREDQSFLAGTLAGVTDYYIIWLVVSFFGIELYNNFWWVVGGLSVVILRVIRLKKTADDQENERMEPGVIPGIASAHKAA